MIILLPTTLYPNEKNHCLYEHPEYFRKGQHKQKLVLYRATMKAYQSENQCEYYEFSDKPPKGDVYDPIDRIDLSFAENILDSKSFMGHDEYDKIPHFRKFNLDQNKRHGYFKKLTKTYDEENRKKFPRNYVVRNVNFNRDTNKFEKENPKKDKKEYKINHLKFKHDEFVKEAIEYVNRYFPDNPGNAEDFYLPVTQKEVDKYFKFFLDENLEEFGPYQDASRSDIIFGFHSFISVFLNNGMLDPKKVVKSVYNSNAPIESKEGFIRQVLGWREYMKLFYKVNPKPIPRYKLDKKIWNQTLPTIEELRKKVHKYAYLNHIERLMFMGVYFLITETDTQSVHNWFRDMFLDGYDWLMLGNVWYMSQGYIPEGHPPMKLRMCTANYWKNTAGRKITKAEDDKVKEIYYTFAEKYEDEIKKQYKGAFIIRNLKKYKKSKLSRVNNIF